MTRCNGVGFSLSCGVGRCGMSRPRQMPYAKSDRAALFRLLVMIEASDGKAWKDFQNLFSAGPRSACRRPWVCWVPAQCTVSMASAMPWPPPMHSVTRPRLRRSRRMEWTSFVVSTAPVARRKVSARSGSGLAVSASHPSAVRAWPRLPPTSVCNGLDRPRAFRQSPCDLRIRPNSSRCALSERPGISALSVPSV